MKRRPDERPMARLPVLEARRTELERCTFCPKLCRSACPVSNAEPRETLIPWGKMSTAYFVARGDVPIEPSTAHPAWACTGCMHCKKECEHDNDVAGTLLDARAALVRERAEPAAARAVIDGFAAREAEARAASKGLGGSGPEVLVVGCAYLREAPKEARAIVRAASGLLGRAPRLLDGCCGLPLLMAGDKEGFARHAERVAREIGGAKVLVHDAGCALAMRVRYPSVGVPAPDVELLVERAAREVSRLAPLKREPVRWHDPCSLGRGLGVYDAPRALLAHLLGAPPLELDHAREGAVCSGAGGLLPVTMPETSRAIAEWRTAGVREKIVTACASSLLSFRRAGAKAEDIATYVARALDGGEKIPE